jgi:hypothetical protein
VFVKLFSEELCCFCDSKRLALTELSFFSVAPQNYAKTNQPWPINHLTQNSCYSFFDCLFAGDLSYGDCVGRLWDSYGDMIAPVSSQLPWMVSPGNHEIEQIFVKEIDGNGERYFSVPILFHSGLRLAFSCVAYV